MKCHGTKKQCTCRGGGPNPPFGEDFFPNANYQVVEPPTFFLKKKDMIPLPFSGSAPAEITTYMVTSKSFAVISEHMRITPPPPPPPGEWGRRGGEGRGEREG